jgi:hypothetical protein
VSVNDSAEKAVCHWDFPWALRIVIRFETKEMTRMASGGISRIRRMILK